MTEFRTGQRVKFREGKTMTEFRTGQRVKFRRSNDKATELTGTIVKFHEDSGAVDIETEADGRLVETSTIETAHLDDVTALEDGDDTTADVLEPEGN
jgi:hypothetical protein